MRRSGCHHPIIQGRKDHWTRLGAMEVRVERWPDSAYVLKVKPRAFGDRPDVECERRKRHWEWLPDFLSKQRTCSLSRRRLSTSWIFLRVGRNFWKSPFVSRGETLSEEQTGVWGLGWDPACWYVLGGYVKKYIFLKSHTFSIYCICHS